MSPRSRFLSLGMFALPVIGFLASITIVGLTCLRRAPRPVEEMHATTGEIVSQSQDGDPKKFTYRFVTPTGPQGVVGHLSPHEGAPVTVLYDPAEPSHNWASRNGEDDVRSDYTQWRSEQLSRRNANMLSWLCIAAVALALAVWLWPWRRSRG